MLARSTTAPHRPSATRAAARGATAGIGTYLAILFFIFVVVPVVLVVGAIVAFAVLGFVLANLPAAALTL